MPEVITEELPRIKFKVERLGAFNLNESATPPLHSYEQLLQLSQLQHLLEEHGVIPILNDGLVGGNCAMNSNTAGIDSENGIVVSKSGKRPKNRLSLRDFVLVTDFDRRRDVWTACFKSIDENTKPTSDTPLHFAALAPGCSERYSWTEEPKVAVHGHALAEGQGK